MSTHKITSSSFGFFKRNFGFTLTELIVVITILAILTTIAFFMLSSYIDTARDSARVSDINTISKALTLYDAKVGSFPEPDGAINVSYGEGTSVWRQGKV
jgi:prepilin-type N-terminal cleavage/methylation domain-containing protein